MYQLDDVASLVSIVMFAVLCLMAFLSRPREIATIAFAVFAGLLAIDSTVTFLMNQVTTISTFRVFMHIAFTVGILVPAGALFHVLACTGFIFRMQDRILGVRVRTLVVATSLMLVVVGVLFHLVFLVDIARRPNGRFVPDLTPLTVVFVITVVVVIAALIMIFMVKALREAPSGARRTYLRSNMIGILLIMVPGPVIGILFAVEGGESQWLLVQGFVLAGSIQFYLAINRYQLGRIQELNVGLEAKVDERTRHLEQAQVRLVQSEKAAALGRLVAGVTHEVSTPTGAIVSSSDTIERAVGQIRSELSGSEEATSRKVVRALEVVADSNAVVSRSGQRVVDLVDNLKSFVHLDGAEELQVDLHRALDCTIDLLRHELPAGVEVVRKYGEIPTVRGNQADLNQVFMHLLRNAGQAINDQGVITIQTSTHGDEVSVELSDNGHGIAPDRLERLFDLQFSSGGSRVKLGVGLPSSHQIVERHGGRISVTSAPAKGTTFTVRLPRGPKC